MNTGFALIDYIVFIAYGVVIIGIGLWVSREKKGHQKNVEDYFLASKSLPWWAIGASLIAANISAEQLVAMSGDGFAIGIGIASYEWMAALTLIVVGKFFMPVFLEKKIFTMPQFLEQRFDNRVRTSLAIFWILVFIFINLTSVIYLGALSLETIMGIPLLYGVIGFAVFAAIYSIYGGLKAVAWTDVIQVFFLVGGGLLTTYLALNAVSGGQGVMAGFNEILENASSKFDMILSKDHDFYNKLPGLSVLIGGLWIANLYYWGFNQYIIQRALAAKNIREAQRGVVFAGYLKLLMPLIVVIPGIVAFLLVQKEAQGINLLGEYSISEAMTSVDPETGEAIIKSDKAYPALLAFIPVGLKGLAFAALAAAIVSSLASMINSTSTIFTMDIYKPFINKKATDRQMVLTGRLVCGVALLIAVLIAPQLRTLDSAFQFIQDFTGLVSPGVLLIFLTGMFWKRMTANAALWVAFLTIPFGFAIKGIFPDFPFMDRMGVVFIILAIIGAAISLLESKENDPKGIDIPKGFFKTGKPFNIAAIGICAILFVLYFIWW